MLSRIVTSILGALLLCGSAVAQSPSVPAPAAPLAVVKQAPGGAHQKFDAAAQVGDLRIDADTAKYSQ